MRGPMTKKWLITILVAIAIILIGIWLYTGYAAEEVEPEVAEDERVTLLDGPRGATRRGPDYLAIPAADASTAVRPLVAIRG